MVFATEVLRTLEVPLAGELIVNTVTDEESTGAGSLASVAAGVAADGGIVPEPTDLTAWLGTLGSLMPEIVVEGRAGHAGFPHEHWTAGGPVNAIERMQPVLAALQALREEWRERPDTQHAYLRTGTIVPTALSAGQWMVSYPASASLRLHVQYLPEQSDEHGFGSEVASELQERVLAAAQADPWLRRAPTGLQVARRRAAGLPRTRGADLGHHTRRDVRRGTPGQRSPRAPPGSTPRPSAARARPRSASGPARSPPPTRSTSSCPSTTSSAPHRYSRWRPCASAACRQPA